MTSMPRLAIAFALLSQLGCVLYDRHIVLVGPPASRACVPGQPVVTVRFVDARPSREAVGALQNGFGVVMSHVRTDDDLGVWATRAVSDALSRAGNCVVPDGGQPGAVAAAGAFLDVAGAVTEAWCDAYFTYWGDVALDVRVTDPSGRSLHKVYRGHGSAGLNVASTGTSYAEALQRALHQAVDWLVYDLEALRRQPARVPPPAAAAGNS